MNIIKSLFRAPSRSFHIERSDGFRGGLVHLGPTFKDGMSIVLQQAPYFLKNRVLENVNSKIHLTEDRFNFFKNGFEFHDHKKTSLGDAIKVFAKGPSEWTLIPDQTIKEHAKEVESFFSTWAKTSGIDFRAVVWIDTVYRNTMAGKFGAVHLVHVDFPSDNHRQTLRGHMNWKDRVVEKLGDMSSETYENLSIKLIANIWMPLDERVVAEPLAIMDTDTLGDRAHHLRVYQDQRLNGGEKYPSVGVRPNPEHRWYIKKDMELGEAVIFNSCLTPHSAVTLPNQGDKTRKSIESRVLFLA
jgi:hypothetical protein